MANRMFDDVKTMGKGRTLIAGKFRTNGTSSPTTTKGAGFSIVRTSTGVYTGTLTDVFYDNVSAKVDIQLNSPMAYRATLKSIDPATKQFVIHTNQESDNAVADVASNANNWVHFQFWMKNSSVGS